jgi:hypothetical protein
VAFRHVVRGTTARLFVRQIIEVIDGHCQTESYGSETSYSQGFRLLLIGVIIGLFQ